MAGRVRGFETVGDMLRSLGVVGVFVAVILLITLRQSPERIKPVDPAPITAAVAQAAPFDALIPGPTPSGWTTTSARVSAPTDRPYNWYVGYSTDTEAFVAVTQNYGDSEPYLRSIDATGEPDGTVVIDGKTWNKLQKSDGSRRALIRTDGDVTTVVLGTAPYPVLQSTAAAMTPAKKAASTSAASTAAASPAPTG